MERGSTMPANLPPQYFEAEKRYRFAKTDEEKIRHIREMLSIMPKHKGTEKLQAELKTKISKLKKLIGQKKKARVKRAQLYHVDREGVAQVVLLGPPNAGKSQLLAGLTNATPEVAPYPFTTKKPAVGMMPYEDIMIQLVDTPPIADKGIEWWFLDIIRNADLLLLVADLSQEDVSEQLDAIIQNLEGSKVRLASDERLSALEAGEVCKKTVVVANKSDLEATGESLESLREAYSARFPVVSVSATAQDKLNGLKQEIYNALGILRVYTKTPGKPPDMAEPVVLKRGSTLIEAARAIHKDFANKLRYARLWGSDRYDGQRVERNHVLEDGDVVEFHI